MEKQFFYESDVDGLTTENATTELAPLIPESIHVYDIYEARVNSDTFADSDDEDVCGEIIEDAPDEIDIEVEAFLAEEPRHWYYKGGDARDFAQFCSEVRQAVRTCNAVYLLRMLELYEYQFEIASCLRKAIEGGDYLAAKRYLNAIAAA